MTSEKNERHVGRFCFLNRSFERTLVEVLPVHNSELEILQGIAHVTRIGHGIGQLIRVLILSVAYDESDSGFELAQGLTSFQGRAKRRW